MDLKRIGASASFIAAGVAFGFCLGGFLGGRVIGRSGMGWDHLAGALGGMMIGACCSLVVASLLIHRLTVQQRVLWAGVLAIAAAAVLLAARVYPMRAQASGPPARRPVPPSAASLSPLCPGNPGQVDPGRSHQIQATG